MYEIIRKFSVIFSCFVSSEMKPQKKIWVMKLISVKHTSCAHTHTHTHSWAAKDVRACVRDCDAGSRQAYIRRSLTLHLYFYINSFIMLNIWWVTWIDVTFTLTLTLYWNNNLKQQYWFGVDHNCVHLERGMQIARSTYKLVLYINLSRHRKIWSYERSWKRSRNRHSSHSVRFLDII